MADYLWRKQVTKHISKVGIDPDLRLPECELSLARDLA
jgi:hypothetical protein